MSYHSVDRIDACFFGLVGQHNFNDETTELEIQIREANHGEACAKKLPE